MSNNLFGRNFLEPLFSSLGEGRRIMVNFSPSSNFASGMGNDLFTIINDGSDRSFVHSRRGGNTSTDVSFNNNNNNNDSTHSTSTTQTNNIFHNWMNGGSSNGNNHRNGTGNVYRGGMPPMMWIAREQQRIDESVLNAQVTGTGAGTTSLQNDGDAIELRRQGNAAFKDGRFEEAVELYTSAIHADPTSVANYTNRSFAYYKLNRFRESARDAERAIELNEHFFKGYYRLACAQMALGDHRHALDNLRRALNEAPASQQSEITVLIAKCEFHLARAPITPLLMNVASNALTSDNNNNNNNNNTTNDNNSVNNSNLFNSRGPSRLFVDGKDASLQFGSSPLMSNYTGNNSNNNSSNNNNINNYFQYTDNTSRKSSNKFDFNNMTEYYDTITHLMEQSRETRSSVDSYFDEYTAQRDIVECEERAHKIKELMSVATSDKLPQLTKTAHEAQEALRRTLKSENRAIFSQAKKTRDEAYEQVWQTARDIHGAVIKLKAIAEDENAFFKRFVNSSPTSTQTNEFTEVDSVASHPNLNHNNTNDNNMVIMSEHTSSSSPLTPPPTPIIPSSNQLNESKPENPNEVESKRRENDNSHERNEEEVESTQTCNNSDGWVTPVSIATNNNNDITTTNNISNNNNNSNNKETLVEEINNEPRADIHVQDAANETNIICDHIDSEEVKQSLQQTELPRSEANIHSSSSSSSLSSAAQDTNHRTNVETTTTSPPPTQAAVGSSSLLNDSEALTKHLQRREEIVEEVRKLQRCFVTTDAAARVFFKALEEEQRISTKLQPLLQEADRLNGELEVYGRRMAHSMTKELTTSRLEALDAVNTTVERVASDEVSFKKSEADGENLLELEAQLERERLLYERQRIKLQAEVEWQKVRDMPESKINALQNHVKALQMKAADINTKQKEIQSRILDLVNADHPELAFKSLASGSRILSLVKGSGLWLNLSLSDFQILSTLSSTINSKVYHALRRGDHVAIKEISIDVEQSRRHFQREVDIVASCTHPNIIRIKGVFFDGPFAYIMMQYYHRGSVKTLLSKKEPISWLTIQDMFRQLATALAYLHERGVVHGDIKPSNILIADDGRPVISDFGIAKDYGKFGEMLDVTVTSTTTNTNSGVTGTINYMAPEQLQGITTITNKSNISVGTNNNSNNNSKEISDSFLGGGGSNSSNNNSNNNNNSNVDSSTSTKMVVAGSESVGNAATALSDIWSLGLTMFELAANNAYFIDESLGAPTMPHVNLTQRRVEVAPRRVGGDEKLADLLSAALTVDLNHRASAYELLAHPYFSTTVGRLDGVERDSSALMKSDERLEAVRSYIHAVRQADPNKILVSVSRHQMVESLQEIISTIDERDLISPIMVVFQGESGVDEGALTTEMLNLFYVQMVNDKHALVNSFNEVYLRTTTTSSSTSNLQPVDAIPSSPSPSSSPPLIIESTLTEATSPSSLAPTAVHNAERGRNGTRSAERNTNRNTTTRSATNTRENDRRVSMETLNEGTYLPADDAHNIPSSIFELLGKVLLKNVIENRPLPLRLNSAILKYFCGGEPSMFDLEDFDSTLAENLKRLHLLSNDDLIAADLDFSHFSNEFLETQCDGKYTTETIVSPDNVRDFVSLRVQYDMKWRRKVALEAIRKGFYSIQSLETHLKLLSPSDLLLLLCGVQHVSAEAVVEVLEFQGFNNATSKTPKYLKEIIKEMSQNNLRRFLLLCTSFATLPTLEGSRKIKVLRVADTNRLPVGHGCVMQLDLPDYNDKKVLKEKLEVSLAHVTDGFHIVEGSRKFIT